MEHRPSPLILLAALAAVMLASGCTGLDPAALAKSNSMIQQFLDDHPNAQIKVTHFTAEQAKNMIDQIRSDCDNPYLDEKEFYRVNITDTDTNFFAVVWIDWANRSIECVYKIGTEGKTIEKPTEGECESHASYKCDSGNLYWFDSCGNKQEKKEYCQYGCSGQSCLGNCSSHAAYRCYGDHVYWFDSCGNKQDKKEYCDYGCENGFCKARPAEKTCEEAGGYCIWPATATTTESGGASTATGMLIITAVATSTTTEQVVYQCEDGYAVGSYFCKEGGICCVPKEATDFCGSSTQGPCSSDSDCITGGCSGQVCQSVQEEPVISTCDYRDCYNAEKYGKACRCVNPTAQVTGGMTESESGKCMWTSSGCVGEDKALGNVLEYGRQVCCSGLKQITASHPDTFPGRENVCLEVVGINGYCTKCGDGVCKSPENFCNCPEDCKSAIICTDWDGGQNYFQIGTTTLGDSSLTDHCNEDGTLTEKYCSGNQIAAEVYQCPNGCSNGACIFPVNEQQCINASGQWIKIQIFKDLSNYSVCVLPTTDGGKICTDGSQCTAGYCLANNSQATTGQCPTTNPTFGCRYILNDGKNSMLCD